MSMIDELERLIGVIDLKKAMIPNWEPGNRDSYDARQHAINKLIDHLNEFEKANISEQPSGARVRICGIQATCTAGLFGALSNWQAAARKKIEKLRAEQAQATPERKPEGLCPFELTVLRAFNEWKDDDIPAGAATNSAIETLQEGGYITRTGGMTAKGVAELKAVRG